MRQVAILTSWVILLLTSLAYQPLWACTDFRLMAKDGTVLITRSMEFALDLHSELRTSPRARLYTSTTPDGKPGLHWQAKYGYVFLDGLGVDVAIDGMNEMGLSIEALYLPVFAEYQTVQPGQESQALPYLQLGDWVLSQFKTVDEVRAALSSVTVFAQTVPEAPNMIFPLHFAIYDASGKGIIVEFVGGKQYIYDSMGVLTNSPTYSWQVTNLVNYLHLAPINPPPVQIQGVIYGALGQGFGMVGLPGDISPPSRFVKTATLVRVVVPANDAADAVNTAQHIINNVDIPLGLAREPQSGQYTNELTQWVVFKDLTHRMFYYRTYGDMTLRVVSLGKLNLSANAPRLSMPIASAPTIEDKTSALQQAVQTPPVAAPLQQPAAVKKAAHA